MSPYHRVWQFETDAPRQAAFETAYASDGVWAELFGRSEGYLGTELLHDRDGALRYVTVDRWTSREAYERFRREQAPAYAELDRRTRTLTTRETFLGSGAAVDRYQRWYAYERDAHARSLASLDTVPAPARSTPPFKRACGLLGHLVMARRLWLFRLGELDRGPTDFFPEHLTPPEIAAALGEIETAWEGYLARLTDRELGRVVTYRSQEGPEFRNRVEDIITQLFGHSSYHRGQVAHLVRGLGGQPAATDYVFWCREPVDPAP